MKKREYKGDFRHFRSIEAGKDGEEVVSCKGGATVAFVEVDNGVLAAAAYCNPIDTFDRSKGRLISDNRLVKVLNNKELADDDKYFAREGSREDFLRILDDYMADLGYVSLGGRSK